MSESDPSDRPPEHEGPALDIDGRLVNGPLPPQPLPPPGFLPSEEPPLELPELPPRRYEPLADAYREEPPPPPNPRRRVAIAVFAAALVVGLGLLAASLVLPASSWSSGLERLEVSEVVGRPSPTVVVTSEPDGANVRIDGQLVGTTPWASDNLWGDTTIAVERPGYVTFTAPLKARANVRVDAQLRRR